MIECPTLYEHLVWEPCKSKCNSQSTLSNRLNFLFFNKNVHKQVSILNRTLMNIFSNFVPNKLVTFNDKDPPRITPNLRNKMK